ncbi:MAG: leucine-rich repeat domain-containing protein [Lawsonibacter sp.]
MARLPRIAERSGRSWRLDDHGEQYRRVKTCTITGYKGNGGEIEIPAEINGYTVKSIGSNVFKNNATITKVTFAADSQCEEIGDYAFEADSSGTSKLKEIVFPNSLKRIGKFAFFNCRALEQFPTLPDGLVTIDDQAFYNVTSAKTDLLVIPASVTRIGSRAFRWCGGIQRIQVKSETISLGAQAFLLGTSSATNRYIDLSTVKNLTLDAEL